MSRPPTIRDEDLLTAARAVFIERGIQATTAEVAQRAGVSEGTLFKRFGSKAALFHACLHVNPEAAPWLRTLDAALLESPPRPVREVLVAAARQVLAFYRLIVPSIMMRWSNPDDAGAAQATPAVEQSGAEPPPLVASRRTTEWFAAEMARGRLRAVPPEVPARVFLGTLFNYAFLEVLQRDHGLPGPEPEAFIEHLVELILRGVERPE
jgi:AcrR family transcriptional regulator